MLAQEGVGIAERTGGPENEVDNRAFIALLDSGVHVQVLLSDSPSSTDTNRMGLVMNQYLLRSARDLVRANTIMWYNVKDMPVISA